MNFRHLAINRIVYLKLAAIAGFFLMVAFFTFFLWNFFTAPDTLNQEIKNFQKGGEQALNDLTTLPSVNLTEEGENYIVEDTLSEGIEITYPNQENKEEDKPKTKVSLPKDYTKPIEIKLDNERIITIQDENNQGYTSDTLQMEKEEETSFFSQFLKKQETANTYLRYQSDRKTLLYSYQRDRATGERKLKHWTFYEEGTGEEKESYKVENATLKKNENGDVELFFQTEQDLKNQAAAKEVDPSLMDRAMRTLEKEGVNQNQNPDLLIPRPYYYDKDGNYQEAEWEVQENKLILNIKTTKDKYPLSVDPTLAFTAPGVSSGGVGIVGDNSNGSSNFAYRLVVGDLNADGKADLAVGAPYSTSSLYIFYNDGVYALRSSGADVSIVGEGGTDYFGGQLTVGDFNADGRVDLATTARNYSTTGRVYIFYNDGTYPTLAANADVKIDGQELAAGSSLASGDLNADGETDLVVGSLAHNSDAGRGYILYNDGSYPSTLASADVIINGQASSKFGTGIATGDLNADGKTDLAIGGYGFSTDTGRAYVFYADGTSNFGTATCSGTPAICSAANADALITGSAGTLFGGYDGFSEALTIGDLNADGRNDLAVGAVNGNVVYIFYGGSITTESYTGADVTIDGGGPDFGLTIDSGDINGDNRVDLIVGSYSENYGPGAVPGAVFVFYNDGSYPASISGADVLINGESEAEYGNMSSSLAVGDMNSDGKQDLVIGAQNYNGSFDGKAYIFYSQNGVLNTNRNITGETTSNNFGQAIATGDFNADGRTDLAVAASGYSTNTGRVYIFHNDGTIPTAATTADVIITGQSSGNFFGISLAAGDFNSDGEVDLVAGADAYSTDTGRVYIFHNDGSIPTTAATADVIITGQSSGDHFGISLAAGDFNADGRVDIVTGAYGYNAGTQVGRTYIFHNDGSIPTAAGFADATTTGVTGGDYFGISLAAGDFNADGRVDIVAGAIGYVTATGRAYILYNDGSIPTSVLTANVIITGNSTGDEFGSNLVAGDFNADGRIDLAVAASGYSTATGRVYIFHNDGSIPTAANSADVIIDGDMDGDRFGGASFNSVSLTSGDFNADGKADLAVGASVAGKAYIFYNDGSIPTTAVTADVVINNGGTGATTLTAGDLNSDGKTDLIVGDPAYSSITGRVYFYEGQRNFSWQLQPQSLGTSRIYPNALGEELRVTGELGGAFGKYMITGDLNTDGAIDLVVSSNEYATNTGRVYIFYSDGNYPSAVQSAADVVIVGETSGDNFGDSTLATGDFNADGKTDLAVGARRYSSDAGRVYVFYNDGTYPSLASNADAKMTGEASSFFGTFMTAGDFSADGKTDLAVGASSYSSLAGRAYVFNGGSITTEAATGADAIITGETSSAFGGGMASGDLNADGKMDLVVGAISYSAVGRVYIFYGGSVITEAAGTGADIFITGTGGEGSTQLGYSLVAGDFNADSKADLAVGGYNYSSAAGRVYIFYGGSIATELVTGADVFINGESSSSFGIRLIASDINSDSKTDLVVGAYTYTTNTGRAYIFYNDGSIPTTASSADVIITGEATANYFGLALTAGDFNTDGKVDLAIGAYGYSSSRGRIYLYTMNDAATASVGGGFGSGVIGGDFNADGKLDLAVGASQYSTDAGRVYIFYGGSALDASVSSADIVITGEASSAFGDSLAAGDFNADGKVDLVVGAYFYTSNNTGRAYIFYNGSIITESATGADIIITGETTSSSFGYAFAVGDFNADGEVDLAVGGHDHSTAYGRAYIFYNGSIITENASGADVIITGEQSAEHFGYALTGADLNADGKTDLVVGAYGYANGANAGRVYIFYNGSIITENASGADVRIAGEAGTGRFGGAMAFGDFNSDGKVDLVVGADRYSSNTGRAYIFYNDGSIPTTAATADVSITGETAGDYFGSSFTTGDLNADGKTDLVVGAKAYSTNTGRVYTFYNDGSYQSLAVSADRIYTGENTGNYFGDAILTQDSNSDSITDLIVGAYGATKTYTFATETKTPSAGTYNQTPDGNEITASVKGGTVKIKGGTIQVK